MWALLGLLLLAVLPGTGGSSGFLICDICTEQAKDCHKRGQCAKTKDTCMAVFTTGSAGGVNSFSVKKTCSDKYECESAQKEAEKDKLPGTDTITVKCTPGYSGSVLLAPSGLLLLLVFASTFLAATQH